MATERQGPDGLLQQVNLSGSLFDIQDDPDSPDANWLTYIANNLDTICRVSFPTPTGNPTVGADLQQFKIWVRKRPGTGIPDVSIDLYENGVLVANVMAATNVTSSTGQLFSATWNASLLGTADGSLVECRIFGEWSNGGPSARCTVEVGAVEWNVTYDEDAAPWLAGYSYRKKIPITGQTGAGTNYQVSLEVHSGSGSDSNGVVYLANHCQDFPNDIRFTGDDGQTLLDYWIAKKDMGIQDYFGSNGISQPLNHINYPSAVCYNNKTYIVWQADVGFDPYITFYNHSTATWGSVVKVASNPLSGDDHGAPSIGIDNNGYIHVFYGCHNTTLKHAKSDNAEDISAFTVQSDVATSASYPKVITDGNNMYVFYRKGTASPWPECYKKSSDNGSSWGGENTFIEAPVAGGRVYVGHIEQTGSQIHMGWCYANAGDTLRWDIYHAYLNISDAKMYSMGGADLGTTITETEATTYCQVVDSSGDETNIPSLHLDSSGYPWMAYLKGSGTSFTFYHVRWNGASWTTPVSIITTDYKWNFTDFIINSISDVDAWLTTAGSTGWGGDIEEWAWNGSAWSKTGTILSQASAGKALNAPMVPINFNSGLRMVFCETNQGDYSDFDLNLYAYTGSTFLTKHWGGRIWIEVADDLGSNRDIYIYYGKLGVSSTSSIADTFIIGDDFNDNSFDDAKWSRNTSTYIKEQNEHLELLYQDLIGTNHLFDQDADISNQGLVFDCTVFLSEVQANSGLIIGLNNVANRQQAVSAGCIFYFRHSSDEHRCYVNNVQVYAGGDVTIGPHTIQIIFKKQVSTKFYLDEALLVTDTTNSPNVTYALMAWLQQWGKLHWIDDIRVRKYVDPEPVVGTAGEEESPSAYYHGWKVQPEGELALCDAEGHPLRTCKDGVIYGLELVAVDDPNASRIRIKTPAGIKAIRKFT